MYVTPIPKTKSKKRRAKNNPKPTADQQCIVCGKTYAEMHETMYGPHRQKAIKYNLQVPLCAEHHRGPTGPHRNREFDLQLKQQSQRHFEALYGHEKWMQEFGKSYL